jgi:hypothetical protein
MRPVPGLHARLCAGLLVLAFCAPALPACSGPPAPAAPPAAAAVERVRVDPSAAARLRLRYGSERVPASVFAAPTAARPATSSAPGSARAVAHVDATEIGLRRAVHAGGAPLAPAAPAPRLVAPAPAVVAPTVSAPAASPAAEVQP